MITFMKTDPYETSVEIPPVNILFVNTGGLSSTSSTWTYCKMIMIQIFRRTVKSELVSERKLIRHSNNLNYQTLTSRRLSSKGSNLTSISFPELSSLSCRDRKLWHSSVALKKANIDLIKLVKFFELIILYNGIKLF